MAEVSRHLVNKKNTKKSATTSFFSYNGTFFFQPKLAIAPIVNAYEREADTIASQVMHMPDHQILPTSISPVAIHRKCAACEEEEKEKVQRKAISSTIQEAPDEVHQPIHSNGQSMDEKTRSFMEARFGYDFSNVKFHSGSEATKSAQSVNALAFTSGNHIVFNEGQYAPETDRGKKLLAHELTHVIQQGKVGSYGKPQIQRKNGEPKQNPSPSTNQASVPKNTLRERRLSFRFRTDKGLPSAKKGDLNTPLLIWYIQQAFNLDELTAALIVDLIQWVPVEDTRAHKKGEFVNYSLSISGILKTLEYLASEGKVDARAVKKFEEIIALGESMTHRDLDFFIKATGNKFTNLNIKGFTVENLNKVEAEIRTYLKDKESILGPLGLLDDYYRTQDVIRNLDFEALKDRLFNKSEKDLTEADKEQILSLFRHKAMRKVFLMLDKANTIASAELKRYKASKQDLAQLITLLTGTYGPSYTEADQLRVKGIYKFIDEYKPDYYSVPGSSEGGATYNFRQMLKYAAEGETALLKRISQIPAENIDFQIANFFKHQIIRSGVGATASEAQQKAKSIVYTKYPEFVEANKKDAVIEERLKTGPTQQYPILYDLSLDFRVLSRLSRAELETQILEELQDKEKKSAETERRLLKEPWLIWEFQPLLYGLMAEEGLSKDDTIGKVIHNKIESVKEHKFWRSIALAALGLALGIAGFFTGGATWAGLALITGSVIVNLIDLHYELKDYSLHAAAAEATFEGGLTQAPSSIGIIFAIGGLVLDFVDVLKIIKPLAKPLTTIDDVTSYAQEIFDQLEAAGKIQKGVTKEAFVKTVVENWKKRELMVKSLAPDIKMLVESDAFKSLHQGVQEGLFKVFDADQEAFAYLLKSLGNQPEILTRLGAHAMVDPKAAEGIAGLYRLTKESALANSDDIFRYYGSIGSNALSSLPEVLNVLRRGTIASVHPELTKLILTNRNLQQALLTHASEPDILIRYWEQYQVKIANLPAGSVKPDFVKYLDEQKAGTRLAEGSAGIPQKPELTAEQIKITVQLTDQDLKQVQKIIRVLVEERGFLSAHQMQAIIRAAESAETFLATTISKNLRGFLYQLNNAATLIAKNGMQKDNVFALLRGLENAEEFPAALKLIDTINNPSHGVKAVDEILSSMTISNLDFLMRFEGASFKMSDLYSVVSRIRVTSNKDGELITLAISAGESAGKNSDLPRLRNILEALEEGQHSFDVIEKAIKAADVFDQKLAKALAESGTGLEDMARLVWGQKGVSVAGEKITVPSKFRRPLEKGIETEGSGSLAYKAVLGNPEKAQKLVKGVMNGQEIDPVKWAVLYKTIDNANIDQTIKNSIIGELWARAGIESYKAKGYTLFKREIPIKYKTPSMSKAKQANADAVLMRGDEILILEFKSGEAVFSSAQKIIYALIKKGEWEHLTIANPALEKLVKANPDKVKFLEVREPYHP